MPWVRVVGGVGRTLITAGLLLLLFVAYQLYGTGIEEARAQDDLRSSFEASLATTTTTATDPPATSTSVQPGSTTTTTTTTTTTAPAPPTTAPTPEGDAVALIRIPRIGVDKAVVEGVTVGDLQKGPGHYPGTPLPGQPGNAAIAGHRTTYGAPFGELGELAEGDEILVTTREGEFRYLVDRISIVSPSQVEVLDRSEEARITLTTCHPKYSARQRLIVSGVLSGDPVSPPPTVAPAPAPAPGDGGLTGEEPDPADGGLTGEEPDPGDGGLTGEEPDPGDLPGNPDDAPVAGADDDPVVEAPPVTLDDPLLAGDPEARAPAAGWGAATALIALGAWLLGRQWRRWPSYGLALPLGGLTLFLCFEQIARLLPSNI